MVINMLHKIYLEWELILSMHLLEMMSKRAVHTRLYVLIADLPTPIMNFLFVLFWMKRILALKTMAKWFLAWI